MKNGSSLMYFNGIYAAGLIGRLTLEALKEKNIKVDYFCDGDSKKWNTEIDNVKVISPNDLDKFDKNIDIIITYYLFSAIVPSLENKGFKNLYLCTGLLTDTSINAFCMKDYNSNYSYVKLKRLIEFYDKFQ